jgi:hypothetical protein
MDGKELNWIMMRRRGIKRILATLAYDVLREIAFERFDSGIVKSTDCATGKWRKTQLHLFYVKGFTQRVCSSFITTRKRSELISCDQKLSGGSWGEVIS